jgi:hypothetical protein
MDVTGFKYKQDNTLDYFLSAIAYGVVQTARSKNPHPKGQHFVLLAKNPHNGDWIGILGIMSGEIVDVDMVSEVYPDFANSGNKVGHSINFYGTPKIVCSDVISQLNKEDGTGINQPNPERWEKVFDHLSK